ncbi:MAG: sigma 54-interacting transcriptional regulator [Planctomycetia bacterium]|nr:sigma 54-interacting transcriptional regulator [Planctomycetia bacterium]
MSSSRSSFKELLKLLDAAAEPLYVVDASGCIVFVNASCAAWLGVEAKDLVDLVGRYHSRPESAAGPLTVQDAANALCPPPAVLAGAPLTDEILSPDGARRCTATFLPLRGAADEPCGVLAVLSTQDAPRDPPQGESPSADAHEESCDLHRQVRRFRRELKGRYRLERLAGKSAAMARLRLQVPLAASSNASVEIIGPPGGACEHVARAIHYLPEPPATARFVALACRHLAADLLSSTIAALFERSSAAAKSGEPAAISTLLLNDADALPAEVQTELSRRLAQCSPTLRVVATAQRCLAELAAAGEFDDRLAGLLSTLTLEIPPLCARTEDIPLLAQLCLEDANAASAKQVGGFTADALDRLVAYPWPRDLAELEEIVRAAHQRAEGTLVTAADLPEPIALALDAAVFRRKGDARIDLEQYMHQIETELILRAMRRAKGNKTEAARLLGMTRPRLYRRLVQLGLEKGAEESPSNDDIAAPSAPDDPQ